MVLFKELVFMDCLPCAQGLLAMTFTELRKWRLSYEGAE